MPRRLFKIAVKIKKNGGGGGGEKKEREDSGASLSGGRGMLVRLLWPKWWEVIRVRALIKAWVLI